MFKWVLVGLVVVGVALSGFSLIESGGDGEVAATAQLSAPQTDTAGFERAVAPLAWSFPRNYGAHYQTEWWYYTGNVHTPEGAALRLSVHHFPARHRPRERGGQRQ
jgi:predicted secreted hydrolase